MSADTNTQRTLGRIEGKLRAMHEDMRRSFNRVNEHDKRITTLEGRMRAVWIIGPVVLGMVGAVKAFKWWG